MQVFHGNAPHQTYLARGVAFGEVPFDMTVEGQGKVQREDVVDAFQQLVIPRGNRSLSISFSVERTHGSLRAALGFEVGHVQGILLLAGSFTFRGEEGPHVGDTKVSGIVAACRCMAIGESTLTTYQLVCGLLGEQ